MRRSNMACIALCWAAETLGPRVVAADTLTLTATRDNTLIESAMGSLSNGAGTYFFAGRTGQSSDAVRRGLIAFDLTSVPARSSIGAVVLTVHLSRAASAATHEVRLHRVLTPWGEGTSIGGSGEGAGAPATPGDATWIHASLGSRTWASPGGDFASAPSATAAASGPGTLTWGSTLAMVADVQAWVDAPESAHGWIVLGDEATARSAKRFASRQNASVSMRPMLTVTFAPPTAVESGTWGRVKELFR